MIEQLKAGLAWTALIAVIGAAIIAYIVKGILGLRASAEAEQQGLDITDHGEEGYIYEAKS